MFSAKNGGYTVNCFLPDNRIYKLSWKSWCRPLETPLNTHNNDLNCHE